MTKANVIIDAAACDSEMVDAIMNHVTTIDRLQVNSIYVFTEAYGAPHTIQLPLTAATMRLSKKIDFFVLPPGLQGPSANGSALVHYVVGFATGRATNSPFDGFADAIKPHLGTYGGFLGSRGTQTPRLIVLSSRMELPTTPIHGTDTNNIQIFRNKADIDECYSSAEEVSAPRGQATVISKRMRELMDDIKQRRRAATAARNRL